MKRNCIIEYNFEDNDGITIRDSSGNVNNGIIVGDFGISKIDKNISIGMDSSMKKPKIRENKECHL